MCPTAAQLRAWWRWWPDANVGVVAGTVSGIVVLDIDPRNGGDASLASLDTRWGKHDATVESITGGEGRHLWFGTADRLPTGPVAPGCDLKGEGGIVVAPPSLHMTGGRYRWRPGRGPDEIAPACPPAWLRSFTMAERDQPLHSQDAMLRTPRERAEFAATWARAGITLRPGDRHYLCPFHDDHHPSLHIDADGCRWICFGCGRQGGIGALRHVLGGREPGPRRRRIHHLPDVEQTTVTLPGDVEVDVIGESTHQDWLLALTGGHRSYGGVDAYTVATLTADPAAPLDPDIVAVRIADHVVGRLRRDTARRYRPLLTYTAREHGQVTCIARVVGGWDRGRQDVGAFGVRILVPELEDVPP